MKSSALGEKLLAAGPDKLTPAERTMVWLYHEAWLRTGESLAPWWRASIREFSRLDESYNREPGFVFAGSLLSNYFGQWKRLHFRPTIKCVELLHLGGIQDGFR